jgi:hypothetical protein
MANILQLFFIKIMAGIFEFGTGDVEKLHASYGTTVITNPEERHRTSRRAWVIFNGKSKKLCNYLLQA